MRAALLTPILRTILMPLLAALIALAAIAGARADGEKRADPTRLSHLALCLQSSEGGDQPAPDHDCGACNLAGTAGLPARAGVLPFAIGRIARVAVERAPRAIPSPIVHLPGSRAPPAVA
jgi:hypothetical protein